MIDYRIINFEKIKDQYDDFITERSNKKSSGDSNEFEPKEVSIDKLSDILGFEPMSIIVVFIPYLTKDKFLKYDRSNLSLHAMSIDYHIISKKILENLCVKLNLNKYYIQCDNGIFNERFYAIHTGLCMKGINGLAIHCRYGSYGFLGLIATNELLPEKLTSQKHCRSCNLCIKHCPACAITTSEVYGNRCLSYLTQKKILSEFEEKLISKSSKVYGCDICQLVCPENKNIKYTEIEDFKKDLLYNIELEELHQYGNRTFKKIYGNRNFSWRGKSILVRNLRLQKNEQTDKSNK